MSDLTDARHVSPNFITEIIDSDLSAGRYKKVVTRFPPEPNGYLHIGHAKAICLNFGIALDYEGQCNLRFDDTNPEKENYEFVNSIRQDVEWLGFKPAQVLFASDYFEKYYECAIQLIKDGNAYVDSVSDEEMRQLRGNLETPGTPSPYRDRSVEENLDLLARMRAGEFPEGAHVLRGKIDLGSPNMKLRDPVLYRILHSAHYHVGEGWHIYPLYDFAHPLEDFIEGISHSICTLEFENNRAIYDWLLDSLKGKCGFPENPRPHQYENARLVLDNTVLSKRKLIIMAERRYLDGWNKPFEAPVISGWSDPRMPTISGIRRRGVRPEAIREFIRRVGVSKTNSRVDLSTLDAAIRDDLNFISPRVMAVLKPLKVVIDNLPENHLEELDAPYWPHDVPNEGSRKLPFTREIYIDQDDFMEEAAPGFQRLTLGGKARLRYAYNITCEAIVKDDDGNIIELLCSYDPESKDGPRGVKGVIHWVSAEKAVPAEFRAYDRLFTVANPDAEEGDFTDYLNPDSLKVFKGFVEPSVLQDSKDTRYQFERVGYYWQDPEDSTAEGLVFNRIVTLKDSFAEKKAEGKGQKAEGRKQKAESKPQVKNEVVLTAEEQTQVDAFKAKGLNDSEALTLTRDGKLRAYLADAGDQMSVLASWVITDLSGAIREGRNSVTLDQLSNLVSKIQSGEISNRIAKDVLAEALESGKDPSAIVEEKGLKQVSDTGALEAVIRQVMDQNPDKVAAYRGGKTGLMGFFVGQVMRETRGQGNPQLVNELVGKLLQG
ncbi:glutamine--tRNA ligase/YqeY domain fusion protein [Deinococcus cellulosilyticus]|uniref:Glutamine--tRNA ligase n=1 Tax=Deinococcus cellulosilyticus (strain DSM 18568 / NBRC 106333 / KACC 11606 / 5516J-15) TaxID=1223518 RepID=A0A511MVE0_DEIC1|nr:glutamine--tRNA ligase/YqeY domain fusion protein [Deinococcus cellulosilyticus]GEM44540.1 glutamine--tRNA ligase [Deinococcus cellulosilyticus NBRC 106333 = KACC 11606]